jgi:lysophospholipase L1-like esterase
MKKFASTLLLIGLSVISAVMPGCVKNTNNPTITITDITIYSSAKKYLALGDSYTIGQSVAATERFPAQIQQQLVQQNIPLYIVEYIATTGWTTLNLQAGINSQNPQSIYDAVSLLIGVNDQYQTHDTTNYRNRFANLVAKAINLAGNRKERVFILSIPDYSVTPFVPSANKAQISKEIDWFNAINNDVAQYFGVSYTNITPSSREAVTNTDLIANDGLHPSGLEYKKWAAMLVPKMRLVLQ